MDAVTSQTLFFDLSSERAMRDLVVTLTAVFHVVPSTVPDEERFVLSAEVDGAHPELVAEVRAIVAERDPAASELLDPVGA
jgi:hypothetical protein